MAWYRVDSRFLQQGDPDGLTLAYVSHGELDTGHLVLHLDCADDVVGFELTYDPFMGSGELYVTWDYEHGVRLGEIDSGRGGAVGLRPKMSPLVRSRGLAATDLGKLLGYVERSAGLLATHHRRVVLAVVRSALDESEL